VSATTRGAQVDALSRQGLLVTTRWTLGGNNEGAVMRSVPEWAQRSRASWRYSGQERPAFAVEPGPGQESVWDYPRPPRLDADRREVVVRIGTHEIARSTRTVRLLETASPPTFYLPPADVRMECLERGTGGSRCEWKGDASYWSVSVPDGRVDGAAWRYANPLPGYEGIRGYLSFYPALVECTVDAMPVVAQPGRFYGGWVTAELVGPFKGEPGSGSW
jgi:uncharacterized protein (DUF427 family)